jgi:acetate kinase
VSAGIRRQLADFVDLAPLHQPLALRVLDQVCSRLPDLPAVACFDTAFHATLAPAASTYAVPREWRERYGIRRYGFHGLSHAYAARRAAQLLNLSADELRVVSCHLGAGCSLAAVRGGVCVDTTMGFTPLEGLVMATRSGNVDPGALLWLQERAGLSSTQVAYALEHDSGLRGLAGTGDLRGVLSAVQAGDGDAQLALDVYVHRLVAQIAAMTASLGGLDALLFTGGVGEHAAAIRSRAAEGLAYLGVRLDPQRNRQDGADRDISGPDASVRTLVVTAREDLEIARGTRAALRA